MGLLFHAFNELCFRFVGREVGNLFQSAGMFFLVFFQFRLL